MSQKYTGGFITKSPVAPTTSAASGIWTLDQQQQAQKAGTWPSPPVFIEDIFSTYLYTDTGSTQTIVNGIDLASKGGMVWAKCRSAVDDHIEWDSARGTSNYLIPNKTNAQATYAATFNSNGVSIPSLSTGQTYVSWTFREQPKFFDIVTYTGNGSAGGQTINHSLGSAPGCIIVKQTNVAVDWRVYHQTQGISKYASLNTTAAFATDANNPWKTPTSTTFGVGDGTYWTSLNESGGTYVAYLFAHDAGGFPVSGGGSTNGISCGTYTGTGSPFNVELGYEPQWVLVKKTSATGDWILMDTMRGMSMTTSQWLYPNTSGIEDASGTQLNPTATGFTVTSSGSGLNGGGATYIYIAIRRGPMKPPTVGTSVFSPLAISNPIDTKNTTNFPIDMQWWRYRPIEGANVIDSDRLRGISTTSTSSGQFLRTSSTAGESSGSNTRGWDNTGFLTPLAYADTSTVLWNFRRAPGFFDEVCYTGTGGATTLTHNLGVVPELMIVKRRSSVDSWPVYVSALGNTGLIFLDLTNSNSGPDSQWNNTTPTASVFSLGSSSEVNSSGATYVWYGFATLAGVSKVGSYTGTGALQTINCGFTTGARFVLIKRITGGTGNWYVWDSARGITAGDDPYILINTTSGAEVTNTNYVDTDTTGFKVTAAAPAEINASGSTFIFLAIA